MPPPSPARGRKRTTSSVSAPSPRGSGLAKRPRGGGAAVAVGATRGVAIKRDPDGARASSVSAASSAAGGAASAAAATERLRKEFIDLFSRPAHRDNGVPNGALKAHFGDRRYLDLVPIINELTRTSRLSMSRQDSDRELVYKLVSDEVASKFAGLDSSAKMVYQIIERAGTMGAWTKDVRTQTNLQQQALTKVFKTLENRRLIKPVKSVAARSKKIYMLYDLTPAKELTGGPWYTELEFDHEFISELRMFVLLCVRKLNGGRGVTLREIVDKMRQAKVSKVNLNLEEVTQLVQTLAYDYRIEQSDSTDAGGEPTFVEARPVSTMCEFKWWDVLEPDFHFRDIVFEDGVRLTAHEPHHHTA